MNFGVINTTLSAVAGFVNWLRGSVTDYATTKSLPEATKLTRVEPLTILSKDCLNLEYMPDVMQSLLSVFSSYYLQAVSLLTKVNDVEVVRILDKLNPDRDETGFLVSADRDSGFSPLRMNKASFESLAFSTHCLESYRHSLPTHAVHFALETDKDERNHLMEITNLSVGKLLNVEIAYSKDGEEKAQKVTLPVSVRLMASVVPTNTIEHLLASKTEDTSVVERYHAWRAGRIAFIKDLIFCQDLIDEHKRAVIGDESGTAQEIMRRVTNAKKYGLLSKNPSLVSASNIFVVTEETARQVESKLGGKLSNPRIRQKAFDNTYAMIICVIDREYERVIFYTRGISASADFSIKEIKAAAKGGKGPDVLDLLKNLQMGAPPVF